MLDILYNELEEKFYTDEYFNILSVIRDYYEETNDPKHEMFTWLIKYKSKPIKWKATNSPLSIKYNNYYQFIFVQHESKHGAQYLNYKNYHNILSHYGNSFKELKVCLESLYLTVYNECKQYVS